MGELKWMRRRRRERNRGQRGRARERGEEKEEKRHHEGSQMGMVREKSKSVHASLRRPQPAMVKKCYMRNGTIIPLKSPGLRRRGCSDTSHRSR